MLLRNISVAMASLILCLKKYNLATFKNSYQVEVLKIQLLANVVYENNFTIEYVKISLNLN